MKKFIRVILIVVALMLFIGWQESFARRIDYYYMDDYWLNKTPGYKIYFKDLEYINLAVDYTSLLMIQNEQIDPSNFPEYIERWDYKIVTKDKTEIIPHSIALDLFCHRISSKGGCVEVFFYEVLRLVDFTEESNFNIVYRVFLGDEEQKVRIQPYRKALSPGVIKKDNLELLKTEQELNRFINGKLQNPFDKPIRIETIFLKELSHVKNLFVDGTRKYWFGSILLIEQREYNDRIPEGDGYTQILYWLKRNVGVIRMEIWDHFYNLDQPQLQMAVGAYRVMR